MRISNFIPIVLISTIIIILYFSLYSSPIHKLTESKLELISGEQLDLAEFKGRPYIIRLFASWCGVCKFDLKELKKISMKMKAPIIAIAMEDDLERISRLKENELPYDYVAIDKNNLIKNLLKNRSIPETIIIDEEGNVMFRHIGPLHALPSE